jgi:hypothetical protein
MLRLAFTVEDADGPRTVTVGPASLVAWERKTGRKVSNFADGIGAEDMAWLVWHAEKRAGNVKDGFDAYLESIVDLSDVPDPKVTSDEGPSAD